MPGVNARWRLGLALGLAMAATLGPGASRAWSQAMLADDVIILSKGQQARKQAAEKASGKAAGAGAFAPARDRAHRGWRRGRPRSGQCRGPAGTDGRAFGCLRV